jgi:hypothetical protein
MCITSLYDWGSVTFRIRVVQSYSSSNKAWYFVYATVTFLGCIVLQYLSDQQSNNNIDWNKFSQ